MTFPDLTEYIRYLYADTTNEDFAIKLEVQRDITDTWVRKAISDASMVEPFPDTASVERILLSTERIALIHRARGVLLSHVALDTVALLDFAMAIYTAMLRDAENRIQLAGYSVDSYTVDKYPHALRVTA